MRHQISHKNIDLNDQMREAMLARLRTLEPLVQHFPEDSVHVQVTVERHRRTQDCIVSLRLVLPDTVLISREQRPALEVAMEATIQDIRDQLARYKSRLGHEEATERAATTLQPRAIPADVRSLLEERELLDRSLQGDEMAWRSLSEYHLPAVTRALQRRLREDYAVTDVDAQDTIIRRVLGQAMALAHRDLARKPQRWGTQGWLTYKARGVLKEELGRPRRSAAPAA